MTAVTKAPGQPTKWSQQLDTSKQVIDGKNVGFEKRKASLQSDENASPKLDLAGAKFQGQYNQKGQLQGVLRTTHS